MKTVVSFLTIQGSFLTVDEVFITDVDELSMCRDAVSEDLYIHLRCSLVTRKFDSEFWFHPSSNSYFENRGAFITLHC